MSVSSDNMRREWAHNDAIRDAGLTTPEDIVRWDNLAYGPVPKWNELDVYRPKAAEGKLPVILVVHGGGWVYGDKELYQFYAMSLAQRGFAVVNFSYRLSPENKFPAQLEDTNAVIAWMFVHQEEYGLDMQHVFFVGDSAGGHLSALYAEICTNPEYAARYDFTVPEGFVPTALGLNCGAYTPLKELPIEGANNSELMGDLLPGGGTPEEAEWIDAVRHVTCAFPPSFIMSAPGDFCLDQVPGLVQALCDQKVPFICKIYGNKETPLYHVFHVTIQEPLGQQCNDDECAFFRSFCGA